MRVGYRHGRAVLLLSSSRASSAGRLRVGSPARRLRGHRRERVGRNVWYLTRGRRARLLFKVRGGRVREVGIASKRLTRRARATRRFLRWWQL